MAATLNYPYTDSPAPGSTLPIVAGLHWVRMPLPFALDHINLWLMEDEDGVTLVDTGFGNASTREHWRTALAGRPVKRAVVTHFHPDHMGNAGWFESEDGAEVLTSERDFIWSQAMRYIPAELELDRRLAFYRQHGMDEEQIAAMAGRRNWYPQGVPTVPTRFHRLVDGQILRLGGLDWRVILTYGHAPEHVCLFAEAEQILIAGDQVLPRISPNIGVWPNEPEGEPLSRFLGSLRQLRDLPADTLVLPSHGMPFRGLRERIDDLLQHHVDRLDDVVAACRDQPLTALEVAKVLFRRELDLHQMTFAMAESIAHLNHLLVHGRLRRQDDNRQSRFHAV